MDFIIVGGGISGLYFSYLLVKKYPKLKISIIEKTGRLGGRVYTYNMKHPISKEPINYEVGAGRIGSNHKLTMNLINEAKLELFPINSKTFYFIDNKLYSNEHSLIKKYLGKSTYSHISELWSETILLFKNSSISTKNILKDVNFITGLKVLLNDDKKVDLLTDTFGYISEIITMNAYNAFNTLENDFDLENLKFFVVKGGLEQLIHYLYDFVKNNVTFQLKTTFTDFKNISKSKKPLYEIEVLNSEGNTEYFVTKHLIMATEKSSLLKIPSLIEYYPLFESVKAEPLLRMYAIYPKKNNKVWFDGLPRIITDTPIQYIIPINYETGLIMISYTDNYFTGFWQSVLLENKTKEYLHQYLTDIFPDKDIPDPIYLNQHFYSEGSHYYLPEQNSDEIQEQLLNIGKQKNIWFIGEAFSNHQAWIEGALETASNTFNQIINYLKGGSRKITMKEVKKHNKKTDAWLVIKNKVYDVTKWIPKHPGGMAIMKGVGTDATELFFNNPAHSPSILLDILPKYYIGDLE